MKIRVYTKKVWWSSESDDKPSPDLFAQFVNSDFYEINSGIKWVDDLTIQVVFQNSEYNKLGNIPTYLYVNNDDNQYYRFYYFDKIISIGSNNSILQFSLDVYATYTMQIFNNKGSFRLKANRNSLYNKNSLQFNDDLLSIVQKQFDSCKTVYGKATTFTRRFDGTNNRWFSNTTNGSVISGSNNWITNACVYYVFAINDDDSKGIIYKNSYAFCPILWNNIDRNLNKVSISKIDSGNEFVAENYVEQLTYIANNSSLANKLVGVFVLPSFYNFSNYWDRITVQLNQQPNYLACMIFNMQKGVELNNINGLNQLDFNLPLYNIDEKPQWNDDTQLHPLIISQMNVKYFNSNINLAGYWFCKDGNVLFNFSQTGYFTYRTTFSNYDENILPLPDNLPVLNDDYLKYLVATKNTRDNALNTALQQSFLGGAKALFGGIASAVSGDVAGGVSSGGFGLISSYFGYSWKKKEIQANLRDKAISTQSTLQFSANKEFVNYAIGKKEREDISPTSVQIFDLWSTYQSFTPNTIKALNNIVYLYGCVNPIIDKINNFLNYHQDFNYLLVDSEYINTVKNQLFGGLSIPRFFYNQIIFELTQGIRVWKVEPNYE